METNNDSLQNILEKVRSSREYTVEGLHIDITEDLLERMEQLGVNQSELAKRIGCNRSYISRAFNRPKNFTLETVAKMAYALDLEVKIKFQPKEKREYNMTHEQSEQSITVPTIDRAQSMTTVDVTVLNTAPKGNKSTPNHYDDFSVAA